MLGTGCRKWTCSVCGPSKKYHLVNRIITAKPNRFLTLTALHQNEPHVQERLLTKSLPRLVTELRKRHGEVEYLRMTEQCADGYPHIHLLLRSDFLPQPEIRSIWARLTGATIVDIRKAHGRSRGYIAKYLQKARDQQQVWSRQRMTVSRNFWVPKTHSSDLIGFDHSKQHPTTWASKLRPELTLRRIAKSHYLVDDREPGDELPEELAVV